MLPVLFAFITPLVCHAVSSERIYARDLAAVVPAFSALQPDLQVGFAPVPGLQRVFQTSELRRIARTNQIEADISGNACFEWELRIPTQQQVLTAIDNALKGRNAEVTLIDQARVPAPKGDLVFSLADVAPASGDVIFWRGYIAYGRTSRFSVWARARIKIHEQHVIAASTIAAGERITPDQLKVEQYDGPLVRDNAVTRLSEAMGMVSRCIIQPGSVLLASRLEKPREVERGDTVDVLAESGGARVKTQGVAEQGGHQGSIISVRNVRSGRLFRARIESKETVIVVPGGPFGLVPEEKKS